MMELKKGDPWVAITKKGLYFTRKGEVRFMEDLLCGHWELAEHHLGEPAEIPPAHEVIEIHTCTQVHEWSECGCARIHKLASIPSGGKARQGFRRCRVCDVCHEVGHHLVAYSTTGTEECEEHFSEY